ncbi:peroxisome biogenesis factor 7, putative [Eimeria maxima]|uniref:Peroxin-7 n=1 Tax=Eimeria maxima TaxID=5804 RepID=U6M3J6_EIMMA|nr:peroxisome biogenesis factor 7, putative [Eimeria maxima]CDJ58807.1 peroxisome biogenesis factor 7, putative [Eimeria maxima]
MGRLHHCGQSCRFSPFSESLIAVASSHLFGMAGPGAVEVFQMHATPESPSSLVSDTPAAPSPAILATRVDAQARAEDVLQPQRVAMLNHKQAVNDVAWSELNAHTLVAGGAGGSMTVWQLSAAATAAATVAMPGLSATRGEEGGKAIAEVQGHRRDLTSLSWSCVEKRLLFSSGLDGEVQVRDVQQHWESPVLVLQHSSKPASCFCCSSPADAALVASVGADGRLLLHDLRRAAPNSSRCGVQTPTAAWAVHAHPCEVLSVDWMKHRPWLLLTGAADGTVGLWDVRKGTDAAASSPTAAAAAAAATAAPSRISSTQAHQLAVRRVVSHPFNAQRFASCSYDMHVKVWDTDEGSTITLAACKEEGSQQPAAAAAAATSNSSSSSSSSSSNSSNNNRTLPSPWIPGSGAAAAAAAAAAAEYTVATMHAGSSKRRIAARRNKP